MRLRTKLHSLPPDKPDKDVAAGTIMSYSVTQVRIIQKGLGVRDRSPTSAVRRVADAIRRDALDRAEGELLGSEQELLDRYGVSRPTLRQAAALVVQENLLRIRRGVGGGYFIARPDSRAVAHVAAVFLRSRRTTQAEILRAVEPLRIELAKLAAACTDPNLQQNLRDFLDKEEQIDPETLRFKDFIRSERDFGHLIGEMSGNHVLSLFLEILYDFSGMAERNEDFYRNRPDRVEFYRARRNHLARAILDEDEELAMLAARRCRVIGADKEADDSGQYHGGTAELVEFLRPDLPSFQAPGRTS